MSCIRLLAEKKVLNIISVNKFYWRKGGSEAVFFGEKDLLEKNGHEVWPFSMESEDNLVTPYSRYFVDEVVYDSPGLTNKISSAAKIIYSFDARKKMKKMLVDMVPDISHFHIFQHQISPSVFGPLKSSGVPIILTLHDLKPLCPNYKMYTNGAVCEQCKGRKFINGFKNRCTKGSAFKSIINVVEMNLHYALGYYQSVDRYIAVSNFYRNKMIEWGFPPGQVDYLPNYIDYKSYDVGEDDGRYVLFFGRLSEEKGIDSLIDAARKLPDVQLKIVGTGPEEDRLRVKVLQENIGNVDFLGFKTGDDLRQLIQRSSFTVTPSVWYENCPMSILESFAYGKAVVGAHIGGIPELIEEGIDGVTFEPGNGFELADRIIALWENPEKARLAGLAGRLKIEQRFGPDEHYRGLMDIYQSVLSDKKAQN